MGTCFLEDYQLHVPFIRRADIKWNLLDSKYYFELIAQDNTVVSLVDLLFTYISWNDCVVLLAHGTILQHWTPLSKNCSSKEKRKIRAGELKNRASDC